MRLAIVMLAAWLWGVAPAVAHEVRPAYLEIRETAPGTYEVLWKVPARGEHERLGIYVRLPADARPLNEPHGVIAGGAYVERWRVHRPGGLAGQTIVIDGLASTGTDVLARLARLDGSTQIARVTPAAPFLLVEASPHPWRIAVAFVTLGIRHIFGGFDHLLFVFAILLIVHDLRTLLWTITSFTVAHSITLALAVLGVVHVAGPPVEATIALSILLLACELIRQDRGETGLTARRPWVVAFVFGLLHGFGFAGAIREVGLPQGDVPLALAAFNIGVEIGQVAFIGVALGGIALVSHVRIAPALHRPAIRLTHFMIGSCAAFWLLERLARF